MKKSTKTKAISFSTLAICLASVGTLTYSRYFTSGTSHDSARVARWGVTIEPVDNSLFNTSYIGNQKYAVLSSGALTSSSTFNVIAPGTSGSIANFRLSGKPEVAIKVTKTSKLDLGVSEDDKNGIWTVKNANGEDVYYCPLVFSSPSQDGTNTQRRVSGMDYDSAYDFQNAVNSTFITTNTFDAGVNLSSWNVRPITSVDMTKSENATGPYNSISDVAWTWSMQTFRTENGKTVDCDDYDTQLADKISGRGVAKYPEGSHVSKVLNHQLNKIGVLNNGEAAPADATIDKNGGYDGNGNGTYDDPEDMAIQFHAQFPDFTKNETYGGKTFTELLNDDNLMREYYESCVSNHYVSNVTSSSSTTDEYKSMPNTDAYILEYNTWTSATPTQLRIEYGDKNYSNSFWRLNPYMTGDAKKAADGTLYFDKMNDQLSYPEIQGTPIEYPQDVDITFDHTIQIEQVQ